MDFFSRRGGVEVRRLGGRGIKITNKLGCDIAVNSSSGTTSDHGAALRNPYCKAYFH